MLYLLFYLARAKLIVFCHFSDFVIDFLGKIVDFHASFIARALFSYGNGAFCGLFFAHDEEEGGMLHLVVADFATYLFGAVVDVGPHAEFIELLAHQFGIFVELVGNGQDGCLIGCEPQWEVSGGVFDEHGHEAFERAEGGAVNHNGAVLLVVGTGVFELEALGQVIVHLNRTELPAASQCILDHKVELRAVEGGLAIFNVGGQVLLFAGFNNRLLGLFPVVLRTDVLLAVYLVTQTGTLCRFHRQLQQQCSS